MDSFSCFEGGNGDQYFNATFQQQSCFSSSDNHSVIKQFDEMSLNALTTSSVVNPTVVSEMAMHPSLTPTANAGSLRPTVAVMDDTSHVSSIPSYLPYVSQFGSVSASAINGEVAASLIHDTSSPLPSRARSPASSQSQSLIASPYRPSSSASNVAIQEDVGGTTYFYTQDDFESHGVIRMPPTATAVQQFTVYPGPMPHVAHMKLLKGKSGVPSFFMPDELKMEILSRQVMTSLQLDPTQNAGLPEEVDNYHQLYPLEAPPSSPLHKSSTFGYQTSVYKAVNTKDGVTYCLRRIHGYRLVNTKCMSDIELWKKMLHPNLVHLREVFTTKAFGDNSMIFVYDYHPGAETLMNRHFGSPSRGNEAGYGHSNSSPKFRNTASEQVLTPGGTVALPESLIWAYIIQLSSVLRTIHAHGLACRVMDPSKILLVDKTRIRLNCVGIFDVVSFDPNLQSGSSQMERYKQEDLTSLGRVILSLANNSVHCLQSPPTAVAFVSRVYSADLKNLIMYLMTPQSRPRNINDIMPMIGARFYSQLEASHLRNDILEQALSKEVENGRLFKLLCKLGTINERPEYSMDSSWSETGDRYMLKLFRDYVFHQVDADGMPWIDMAHVIQCLNKLNAGVPEKICLSSRDDDIVMLVSYAELKRCVETSFSELTSTSHRAASSNYS